MQQCESSRRLLIQLEPIHTDKAVEVIVANKQMIMFLVIKYKSNERATNLGEEVKPFFVIKAKKNVNFHFIFLLLSVYFL